jgi:hypothetical protein
MALLAIPAYLAVGIVVPRLRKRADSRNHNQHARKGYDALHGVAPFVFTSSVP